MIGSWAQGASVKNTSQSKRGEKAMKYIILTGAIILLLINQEEAILPDRLQMPTLEENRRAGEM
jgi:hypothetical protein